ncbi:prolyl 3-hydroxylase 1-like isoform X2 [Dreissena polymorpha]|uniref:prolyl 3-hydroxylase 1-like isoform X2 n=1 Tax=Dreissena polymorpha TaxID=45954 RepID=UPI002263D790|nr:prolyl 3-hydroxylase 1-like isoform X2 [Dreissena polymorpha]
MEKVLLLLSLFVLENCNSLSSHSALSYEQLYDLGMDAYKNGKWDKCSSLFQKAIDDYHFYKRTLIDCRLKCKDKKAPPSFSNILVEGNCLRKCKKKVLGFRAELEVSFAVNKKFEERAPYNYMSFCYFKDEQFKAAASAAFTYYVTHPEDERTLESLQFYRLQKGVEEEDFVDKEKRSYQSHYISGLTAYNDREWVTAADHFQQSLSDYFIEEERCRVGCENGFVHGVFPDFINAIADHYLTVLVCEQKCLKMLSTFGTDEVKDFVCEHFNYLQYAYYQANNFEKAFESIANYLLFKPKDGLMLSNIKYYMETLGYSADLFTPSKIVREYVDMWKAIDSQLDFIRESYILPNDVISPDAEAVMKDSEEVYLEDSSLAVNRSANVVVFEKLGLHLVNEGKQFKGNDRFMADGLIRDDQCAALADLARAMPENEFGVRSASLKDSVQIVSKSEDYEISMRLFFRGLALMRLYTSAYFDDSSLHVSHASIVCRSGAVHSDLSLPESCVPQEDGSCWNPNLQKPKYTVVAYLTDNTDGTGQFYFRGDNGQVQAKVDPICGRLVGFGRDSRHGLNLSWRHDRCALVVQLSSVLPEDPGIQEVKKLMAKLDEERMKGLDEKDNAAVLNEFYKQGVKVSLHGEQLFGRERFVADGLSTPAECDQLISLARLGKVAGDGYPDGPTDSPIKTKFVSPYSKYEVFEGLNISRSLMLVDENRISANILHLFLDISEHARLLVEKFFNQTRRLYFDYTHLVCRTALDGDTEDVEKTLSHPVHADNCIIQDDGSCEKDPLAYVQRTYSAVMYLNDDFEGGQFFFAHKNKSEQVSISPTCGRIVAFNAGEYHGVKGVTKGQRCAIAMWFTNDPNFVEVSRLHAIRRLRSIDSENNNEKHDGLDDEFDTATGSNDNIDNKQSKLERELNSGKTESDLHIVREDRHEQTMKADSGSHSGVEVRRESLMNLEGTIDYNAGRIEDLSERNGDVESRDEL